MVLLFSWGLAQAAGPLPETQTGEEERGPHLRLELKREYTNRGTPEHTSKSQLRIEALLEGAVSLLRLDLPFPDQKTSFEGDPFSPRLGDIKIRVGFAPLPPEYQELRTFLEFIFPTADPESLGSGKYQIAPGVSKKLPIRWEAAKAAHHRLSLEPLLKQVVSVTGDEDRKDLNYSSLELACRDTWRRKYWLELKPILIVDWEEEARTGAVLEAEGGWIINHRWKIWLMVGQNLWGEGVPSTYDKRIGINISAFF